MGEKHYLAWIAVTALWPATAMSAAPGWTNAATAATVYSGGTSLDMNMNGMNSPMVCSVPNNYRLPGSVQGFTTIVSVIMTGFAESKHLVFYVTGCDTDGTSLISSAIVQAQ